MLLHGSCSNSAFWFGEMMLLAQRFHVFAADLIGEAGNSAEVRPAFNRTPMRAGWNKCSTRSNSRAIVIGNSLGDGWR